MPELFPRQSEFAIRLPGGPAISGDADTVMIGTIAITGSDARATGDVEADLDGGTEGEVTIRLADGTERVFGGALDVGEEFVSLAITTSERRNVLVAISRIDQSATLSGPDGEAIDIDFSQLTSALQALAMTGDCDLAHCDDVG